MLVLKLTCIWLLKIVQPTYFVISVRLNDSPNNQKSLHATSPPPHLSRYRAATRPLPVSLAILNDASSVTTVGPWETSHSNRCLRGKISLLCFAAGWIETAVALSVSGKRSPAVGQEPCALAVPGAGALSKIRPAHSTRRHVFLSCCCQCWASGRSRPQENWRWSTNTHLSSPAAR